MKEYFKSTRKSRQKSQTLLDLEERAQWSVQHVAVWSSVINNPKMWRCYWLFWFAFAPLHYAQSFRYRKLNNFSLEINTSIVSPDFSSLNENIFG